MGLNYTPRCSQDCPIFVSYGQKSFTLLVPDDAGGHKQRRHSDTNDDKASSLRSILSIETKNLNPENEMKKIFGSRVIQTEHHGARHRRGGPSGLRNRASTRASHFLVVPKPNWPNATRTGKHHGQF